MKIDQSACRIWALLQYWQHRSKHRDRLGRNNDSVQLERVSYPVSGWTSSTDHIETLIIPDIEGSLAIAEEWKRRKHVFSVLASDAKLARGMRFCSIIEERRSQWRSMLHDLFFEGPVGGEPDHHAYESMPLEGDRIGRMYIFAIDTNWARAQAPTGGGSPSQQPPRGVTWEVYVFRAFVQLTNE
ncbi:hypothetical protein HZH68_000884 [Vespula germanica]|uniref:Uncharacterized protein n=1 Tax=Vespula germanica TaxID=30212 RepID=A0A834U6A0_VESGE|nr:hypothetical protein HZH68_000884 [Vespula germanica]